MARIIDGKAVAAEIKAGLRQKITQLKEKGVTPGLAVILAGDDPASRVYVGRKEKTCLELGIYSRRYDLPGDVSQKELLSLIGKLATDAKIHGILVQLPLPGRLNEAEVIAAIPPHKDVDAFHHENVGRIMTGDYRFLPCTPAGIMELLASCGVEVNGSECVVVGRSNIVGKPMAMLLLHKHGTVTVCHSRTHDLAQVCRRADILVCAAGKPGLITADMIKPGATVIDVGMNRAPDGSLCGDVDFASAQAVAGWITPVPGGVGPTTIAMLMKNTVTAAMIYSLTE